MGEVRIDMRKQLYAYNHKDIQEGASNEWLEAVTDEVYNQLDL